LITGFNTDVQHHGVTYHVQTEDKGLDSPLILSLVYVGGAIIASKRTYYEDLVAAGFDEGALTERLQRQHKLICAAIKAGRVEELKRMGAPSSVVAPQPEAEPKRKGASSESAKVGGPRRKRSQPEPPPVEVAPPEVLLEAPTEMPVEVPTKAPVEVSVESGGYVSGVARVETSEPDIIILTTLADEISALGSFISRPEPKHDVQSEPAPPAQPEAIPLEAEPVLVSPLPLSDMTEAGQDSLNEIYLSLLDDEGDFRAGQLVTVKVHVGRGAYGQRPVVEAAVTVKVLGTSFRPIILTTTTDALGVAVVRTLLPRFTSGRAAIIIRAVAGDESAEMRRIIHQ
jgi:hypothetical protein